MPAPMNPAAYAAMANALTQIADPTAREQATAAMTQSLQTAPNFNPQRWADALASAKIIPPGPVGVLSEPTDVLTTIRSLDFFNRFTDPEKVAIYAAATANPVIGVGLIHGLAAGRIDLIDPTVKSWMDGLVAAGVITTDRETAILTP